MCCLLRAGFQEAMSVSVSRGWGKGTGQHWPWPKAAGTRAQGLSRTARNRQEAASMWPAGPQRAGGRAIHHLHSSQETGRHGHPRIHTSDNHLQRTGRPGLTPTFQRFPHSLQTTKVVMGSSELRVCTCGEGRDGGVPSSRTSVTGSWRALGAGLPWSHNLGSTPYIFRQHWPHDTLALLDDLG